MDMDKDLNQHFPFYNYLHFDKNASRSLTETDL